ncbi:MAG: hypothetical protein M5U34_43975 [Chloroflexi bacterium]|nr:hypothetical protein [Chloroflexota bacterium]
MGLVVLAVGRPLLSLAKNSLQRDELMLSQAEGGTKEQRDLLDQFLALFVLAYAVVHWLLAAPVWDRYLLALIPLVAILIARLLKLVSSHVTSQYLGTRLQKFAEISFA